MSTAAGSRIQDSCPHQVVMRSPRIVPLYSRAFHYVEQTFAPSTGLTNWVGAKDSCTYSGGQGGVKDVQSWPKLTRVQSILPALCCLAWLTLQGNSERYGWETSESWTCNRMLRMRRMHEGKWRSRVWPALVRCGHASNVQQRGQLSYGHRIQTMTNMTPRHWNVDGRFTAPAASSRDQPASYPSKWTGIIIGSSQQTA